MLHPFGVMRDRLARWLSRAGWSVGRAGQGELWLLPGLHLVTRYRYLKVSVHVLKRTYTYERRS